MAGVEIYGGFDPVVDATDTDASSRSGGATILSGDLASNDDPNDSDTRNDNSYSVVTITGADVTLDGLTITAGEGGNETQQGAGLYAGTDTASDVVVTNCLFTNNNADDSGGGAYFNAGGTLINCVFTANSSHFSGGGVLFDGSGTATVVNSTFYNNTIESTGLLGSGISVTAVGTTLSFNLRNSILIGNTSPNTLNNEQLSIINIGPSNAINIQNNLIEGGTIAGITYLTPGVTGILEANTLSQDDPLVVFASTNEDDDDYLRLSNFSPAVGAGNNAYIPVGITTDAAGEMRIQNGTVDLGAYESGVVTPVAQAIMFTSSETGTAGNDITLTATTNAPASAMLPITFAITEEFWPSGTPAILGAVATLDAGVLTLIGSGTVMVTATQAGGEGDGIPYATATVVQTIRVTGGVPRRVTMTGAGNMDGRDWANAARLRTALEAVVAGDQIWIAFGTYKPATIAEEGDPKTEELLATFTIPAGVQVYGGFEGTEDDTFDPATTTRMGAATILSGDLAGNDTDNSTTLFENSRTVVIVGGADVTLDGLTIKGGSRGVRVFESGSIFTYGAGLYSNFANTSLNACTFIGSRASDNGGGAYFGESATLRNCVFSGNIAVSGNGGGLYLADGGTIINTTVYDNTALGNNGGGIYVAYSGSGNFNLQNSILVGNMTTDAVSGHQVYVNNTDFVDHEAIISNNLIAGNGIRYENSAAVGTSIVQEYTEDETDPELVFASIDVADDNYLRLKDGSPAVGAGNNDFVNNATPPITTDAVGAVRIQGGTVDLGAYESAFVPPTVQVIAFDDPTGGAVVRVGQSIGLVATTDAPSDAMLAITFTSSATDIAVVENDGGGTFSLRLDGAGDVTITATQAGGIGADGVAYAMATATQTITVMAALPAVTTIRRVVASLPMGSTEDGSSWANAMTLQDALMASTTAGDQVWIAAGTYKPDATNQNATFTIPEGVLVYGGFDPVADVADTDASSRSGGATTLSGDLGENDLTDREDANYTFRRTDNSHTVVTIMGANVTLDGLTIEAGEGETSSNGGGLFTGVGTTGATLTTCTFNNNSADDQGGGAYFTESATLTDCTFNNNSADDNGGGAYFSATATVTNCIFTANTANDLFSNGGGAYFFQAATVTNCTFIDNETVNGGGGAYFSQVATVTNCTFTDNETVVSGGGAYFSQAATVTNCTFTDNETTNNGGGVYFDGVSTVINSTLYNNSADRRGGGLYVADLGFPFTLQNSILVGNTATDVASGHQTYVNNTSTVRIVNIQHNLIAGGADPLGTDQGVVYRTSGSANITETGTVDESDADVVFASTTAANENYLHLAAGSPAVNAGNNLYLKNGTPGNTDDDIKTDAAGDARIQGGTVDLGAYERAAAPTAQVIAFDDPTGGATARVGQSIDLVATTDAPSDAMLAITFTSSATNIAVVENDNDGTFSLRFDGVGDVTITATQAGGTGADGVNYAMTTATQTITVMAALLPTAQVIAFDDPTGGATARVGESIDLVATTDAPDGAMLAITFTSSAINIAAVENDGDGTFSLRFDGVGDVTITATQAGGIGTDGVTYAMATATQTITVSAALPTAQTLTFDDPTGGATVRVGQSIDLVATTDAPSDAMLAITFTSSATNIAVVENDGDGTFSLRFDGVGDVTITATQAGGIGADGVNYAMATATQTITVSKGTQTITFTSGDAGTVGADIELMAMATSGLDVTFAVTNQSPTSGSGEVVTLASNGTTLSLTGAGTVTITATQAGDANFAMTTQTQVITITPMVVPPATQTIAFTSTDEGQAGSTITLAAMASSGLTPVTFAITDQSPASGTGDVATLSGTTLTLVAAGMVTITASQAGGDINSTIYAAATQTQVITITVPPVVLGIEETVDDFVLYPNPTSGKLHFSEQVAEFRLYGIEGRLLETRKNVHSADLSVRPAGLYFVEVVRGERSFRWRVVRE